MMVKSTCCGFLEVIDKVAFIQAMLDIMMQLS
jgi:hypothetical protein